MAIQVSLRNKEREYTTILDSSILEGYNDSLERINPRLRKYLTGYGESNNQLTGSSPLMNVYLLNSGLISEDARLVTREDLEKVLSIENEFLGKNYVDFGLALRIENDSYKLNGLLIKVLLEDLRKRGIKLGKGKLISLNLLKLKEDEDSTYGCVFELNDKASKDSIKDLEEYRWDYSRNEGLTRAYLDGDRRWNSYDPRLDGFNSVGRVVVVSGEATAQKFLDNYISRFKKENDREIKKIEEEYSKRIDLLKVE